MGRSRGQVILIAALGIAVTFVALALITNTAIYTENLATRETVSGQDAIASERAVEDGAGGLLALANRYNASGHDIIRDRFETDVANLHDATANESARYGNLVSVSVASVTNGSRISQNASGNFTDASGTGDWTLATNVSNTRRFEMNVSQDSLNASSPFTVVVTNATDEWRATVAPNGTDATDVTISNDSEAVTCTATGETTVVDLTEGSLDGTTCDAPTFGSGVLAPYDLEFHNATNGEGRYVLFVDAVPDDVDSSPYVTDPADEPNLEPAIYAATLDLTVRHPDLTYETTVTVAPEDSPEGERYGTVP